MCVCVYACVLCAWVLSLLLLSSVESGAGDNLTPLYPSRARLNQPDSLFALSFVRSFVRSLARSLAPSHSLTCSTQSARHNPPEAAFYTDAREHRGPTSPPSLCSQVGVSRRLSCIFRASRAHSHARADRTRTMATGDRGARRAGRTRRRRRSLALWL